MIITGHQPNYLPYIGFFHKISLAQTFVIVDTVQYVKRGPFGWMNRNRIRTADGPIWLTVPVITKGRFTQPIIATAIDNSRNWTRKHWQSIERNYHKAPHFARYATFFDKLYQQEWKMLADLNEAIIRYLIDALGIKVNIVKASQLNLPPAQDGTDLIINICKSLNADAYIHGRHGADYVDEARLKQYNITSIYQGFRHPVYKQQYEPFIPEMSVIDLLFNCGPDSRDVITGKTKP
ncbi:MAG: WbqC family protein [Planctomycetes bacterium]|nr:WbqC family protein [Planctomycetota bacterium]